MNEMILLQAIADYGEAEVIRAILPVRGSRAIEALLRSTAATETVKIINWVRTEDGQFVKLV